jgi:hypothetical protein
MEKNSKIEILLKEYDVRGIEISETTSRYHKQTNFTYLYASVIIAIAGVFSSSEDIPKSFKNLALAVHHLDILFIFLLSMAALMGFYLFATTMNSLYMIYLNSARRAALEELINKEMEDEVLVWDTKIIARFFSIKFQGVKSWINPSLIVGMWILVFFIGTNFFLCFLCSLVAKRFLIFFVPVVALVTLAHVQQYIALNTAGIKHILSIVATASKLPENFWIPSGFFSGAGVKSIFPISVPIFTVLLGPLPMAYLSYVSDSFWFNSLYPFSFLRNSSVVIGDFFLIPFFNFYLVKLLYERAHILKRRLTVLILVLCGTFILSTAIQFFIHLTWIRDPYTGFMDLQQGQLSFAGWWHLWFSIVEFAFILFFIFVWLIKQTKNAYIHTLGTRSWRLLLVYFALGVVDFVIKISTVYPQLGFLEKLQLDWPMFLKLGLGLLVYFYARSQTSQK